MVQRVRELLRFLYEALVMSYTEVWLSYGRKDDSR